MLFMILIIVGIWVETLLIGFIVTEVTYLKNKDDTSIMEKLFGKNDNSIERK